MKRDVVNSYVRTFGTNLNCLSKLWYVATLLRLKAIVYYFSFLSPTESSVLHMQTDIKVLKINTLARWQTISPTTAVK